MLADVVDEAGVLAGKGGLANVFDGFAFEARADDQLVAVVDIGQVMLVVVKLQRLSRHVRRQRVVGIGQIGKFEGHGAISVVG